MIEEQKSELEERVLDSMIEETEFKFLKDMCKENGVIYNKIVTEYAFDSYNCARDEGYNRRDSVFLSLKVTAKELIRLGDKYRLKRGKNE